MNNYCGLGRLTADPMVRYTKDNTAVANFTLAIRKRYKRDGEPDANFLDFVAFGKTAEIIERYVNKGDLIAVEAEPENSNYTDKNGNKIRRIVFRVTGIDFAGGGRGSSQGATGQPGTNKPAQGNTGAQAGNAASGPAEGFMDFDPISDDGLPF